MNPIRLSLGSLALLVLGLLMGRLFLDRTLAAQGYMDDGRRQNYQEHTVADFEEASAQAEIATLRQRRAASASAEARHPSPASIPAPASGVRNRSGSIH